MLLNRKKILCFCWHTFNVTAWRNSVINNNKKEIDYDNGLQVD